MPRQIFFCRHCAISFTNAGRYYFLMVEDSILFGVAVKISMFVVYVFSFQLDVNLSRSGSFDIGYEGLDDATSGEGR